MANDELLTEFKKNNKYTYIYKLSEQQIFSQLAKRIKNSYANSSPEIMELFRKPFY